MFCVFKWIKYKLYESEKQMRRKDMHTQQTSQTYIYIYIYYIKIQLHTKNTR